MNVTDRMRLFADGQMSVHDIYALLQSMGYSREECVTAFGNLLAEDGTEIRVSKYNKTELHADLFIKVAR